MFQNKDLLENFSFLSSNYRKTGYMRNGTEIANPFTKGVRLLECPLIGERTVFQFGHTVFCVMLSFTLFSENVGVLENREITSFVE